MRIRSATVGAVGAALLIVAGLPTADAAEQAPVTSDAAVTDGSVIEMLSRDHRGRGRDRGASFAADVSADGRYALFLADARMTKDDVGPAPHLYVRDRVEETTTLVDKAYGGQKTKGETFGTADISADGRYVLFSSEVVNLVAGDRRRTSDVFRRDLLTGDTVLVSATPEDGFPDGESLAPVLSAGGRYAAFVSYASDLVDGVASGSPAQSYVRDMETGEIRLVSRTPEGDPANDAVSPRAISADGRFLLVVSEATDLTPGEDDRYLDVFLIDIDAATTVKVSMPMDGGPSQQKSYDGDVSADGRFVVFESAARNLVEGDTNGTKDVFLWDADDSMIALVSHRPDGRVTPGSSGEPTITADGNYVAYTAVRPNRHVPGIGRCDLNIIVRDVRDGSATLPVMKDGGCPHGETHHPFLSADGFLVFTSTATLVFDDGDVLLSDVFGTTAY